ncbi:MAG: 5-deoxy-glucuronate isomerase, partial [Gemmatimonadales bacterium]|nr:5-deoxy-glucuronate isomerase [Gemmatimonadales bacterium]
PDLQHIGFGLLSLSDGACWANAFREVESALVILGGQCDVEADGRTWERIGERADVFDGRPTAVYLPAGSRCRVRARGDVRVAVCAATALTGGEPTLISPDAVGARTVGRDTFERTVYDILVPGSSDAERLIVGETINGAGLWSGYPPHKHDVHNPPEESRLEEVFYFRLNPAQGFGLQRVYGGESDRTYAVKDTDVVTISGGYHTIAAAPGYQLYYLWILAGEHRVMHLREDPEHCWLSTWQ